MADEELRFVIDGWYLKISIKIWVKSHPKITLWIELITMATIPLKIVVGLIAINSKAIEELIIILPSQVKR